MPANQGYQCFDCGEEFEQPDTTDYIDLQQTVKSCPTCGGLDIYQDEDDYYPYDDPFYSKNDW